MISKILAATDGSKPATQSLQYAVKLAKKVGAELTVLTVIDKSVFIRQSVPSSARSDKVVEPIEDYMKRIAESYLQKAAKICGKHGVRSRTLVRTGHPVEEIIREAKRSKADLIILGSHGKSAITAAVVGSVTFGVINRVKKMPILVVR
jgi:nucleotide-binding universal stress UspA family protein